MTHNFSVHCSAIFHKAIRRSPRGAAHVVILMLACTLNLDAQSASGARARGPFSAVASAFERQRNALGHRATSPGREQVLYAGEFVNAITGKRSAARVTLQFPDALRLEGFGPIPIWVNGGRKSGAFTKSDQALVETFLSDTVEGMLTATQKAAARFLGARFGADPRTVPNFQGPFSDVYEVTAPVPLRTDAGLRMKIYYFDSNSSLLQKTRYQDQTTTPAQDIETRFSQWGQQDGSRYPGLIERYENGQLVFSFRVTGVQSGSGIPLTEGR